MIKKLQNEKDHQYIERLESMLKKALVRIDTMTKQLKDADTVNMRTGKKYKDDAEALFMTVAAIESILRSRGTEAEDLLVVQARGALMDQGFDIDDIYRNKAIKDGAYFGKN